MTTVGPSGVEINLTSCFVASDTRMICTSVEGAGVNHLIRATIAGQDTAPSSARGESAWQPQLSSHMRLHK